MIFLCGGLVLLSLILTALNSGWIQGFFGTNLKAAVWVQLLIFKLAAIPVSMLALFLVYWLLPNRKVDPGRVAPVAIVVGLILEGLKYVNLAVAPLLTEKLRNEYSIFRFSATILLLSFIAALIVLGGAHWTARHDKADPLS
jgi:membrane protein/epoxyqueuosine reductase